MSKLQVSDGVLRKMIAKSLDRGTTEWAKQELRKRVSAQIERNFPVLYGRCGHGLRVVLDDCGVYSSGYVCHVKGGICGKGAGVDVRWEQSTVDARERLVKLRMSLWVTPGKLASPASLAPQLSPAARKRVSTPGTF